MSLNRRVFKWRLKVRMFECFRTVECQQVESSRWMEQQQKKRDGPVRSVCEERRASEHRSIGRAQSPRWCTGLYQLAEICWSGCGLHRVSQYSQFIGDRCLTGSQCSE